MRMLARHGAECLLAVLIATGFTWDARSQSAASASTANATTSSAPARVDDAAAIRAVLGAQVAAWNRGDIPGFMQGYDDSPETTFIGADLHKGYATVLERYRSNYSTREQMGTLGFLDLDVRLLPSSAGTTEYAVVTGHFHLARKVKGKAAKDDGIFSLLFHKGASGWKIILDHTS